MKTFYIVGPTNNGDGSYHLLTEDGEHLASHYCSNAGFAEWDLEKDRPKRKVEWKKRFGEYRVVWIGSDKMTKEKLLELNKKWGLKKEELPSVTVVVVDDNKKEHTIKKTFS